MTALFSRDIKVIAGPLSIEQQVQFGARLPILKIRFDITKTNNREPNKAELSIWNLQEQNRAKLQEKDLEVIIEAGYLEERNQIFKGDIETTTIGRSSVDWITTLELGDGSKQMQSSRINQSFRGPQTPGEMLKKVASALGLDTGNLNEKAGGISVLKEFIQNVILSGKVTDVIDDIASSMGLNFSVQDKSLQFLSKGEVLPGPEIPLQAATGLIGSPSVGEKGVVTAVSLLNGRYKPGVGMRIKSLVVSGSFVVQKVQHVGDTWGDEWTTNLELKPLS